MGQPLQIFSHPWHAEGGFLKKRMILYPATAAVDVMMRRVRISWNIIRLDSWY
jgi:hypothetical protein